MSVVRAHVGEPNKMFFYLGHNCELLIKQVDGLFTDLGWTQNNNVYYKGYCLDYDIHSNIDKILDGDKPQGIYCVIKDNKLFYPEIFPFPLYQHGDILTNLRLENFNKVEHNRYTLPTTEKTLDTVVKNITNILVENLSKFELNLLCTGGIDSMMLIAIAEYAKLPYTIHIAKQKEKFTNIKDWEGTVEEYNSDLLIFCRKNYWAYEFLSNFHNKIITTGFYGDEYFCRSIWQIHQLANGFGLTGIDATKSTDYSYKHITKPKYSQLNKLNEFTNPDDAKLNALNTLGASQAWHLDNTITFCPLMDKRIVENVWSLNAKTLLECSVDAIIQKEIIKNTSPNVLLLVDNHKNDTHGRKNFFDNIQKTKLNYCTEIIIH